MFENVITNIRRKFKSSAAASNRLSVLSKPNFRDNLFKSKSKRTECVPEKEGEDLCLSPRAVGLAECARTDIAWPTVPDHQRNILDKFTEIITITAQSSPRTTRKRNDREEIRRRLAMGAEVEEFASGSERPGRKPSLHSRLQSGMNLQICFMNETVSDNESQNSDTEKSPSISSCSLARGAANTPTAPSAPPAYSYMFNHPYQTRPLSTSILRNEKTASGTKVRPTTLSLKPSKSRSSQSLGHVPLKEADFHALQATLQTEARVALAQAKEMARIHMERERRCRAASPVTEMLRKSLEKASAPLAADRRRVSRHLLTDMNVAQLQVIVNSLHGEVELLSEALVRLLMARDELHMGQDSMLVDIEDLTRYLGVKEQGNRSKAAASKSGVRRLAALVHK